MSQERLENLFSACDRRGTGFIDSQAFRELCASFEIDGEDADSIFTDLDHDGDNKISFEDFAFGFRDFLTPGVRRGSSQLALSPSEQSKTNQSPREQSSLELGQKFSKKSSSSINKCEVIQEELPSLRRKKTFTIRDKNSSSSHTNNGARTPRNSATLDTETKQKEMEIKHKAAKNAWAQFTKNVGKDDVNKFLESRYVFRTFADIPDITKI